MNIDKIISIREMIGGNKLPPEERICKTCSKGLDYNIYHRLNEWPDGHERDYQWRPGD